MTRVESPGIRIDGVRADDSDAAASFAIVTAQRFGYELALFRRHAGGALSIELGPRRGDHLPGNVARELAGWQILSGALLLDAIAGMRRRLFTALPVVNTLRAAQKTDAPL